MGFLAAAAPLIGLGTTLSGTTVGATSEQDPSQTYYGNPELNKIGNALVAGGAPDAYHGLQQFSNGLQGQLDVNNLNSSILNQGRVASQEGRLALMESLGAGGNGRASTALANSLGKYQSDFDLGLQQQLQQNLLQQNMFNSQQQLDALNILNGNLNTWGLDQLKTSGQPSTLGTILGGIGSFIKGGSEVNWGRKVGNE